MLVLSLKRSSLSCLSRCLRCLVLTPTPAKANPTTTNREALHLLDSALGIWLAHKLHEPAVLPHRDFDVMDLAERSKERP